MISIIGMNANRGHGSEPWAEEEAFAAVTILFWADEKNSCAPNTWTLKLRSSVFVTSLNSNYIDFVVTVYILELLSYWYLGFLSFI